MRVPPIAVFVALSGTLVSSLLFIDAHPSFANGNSAPAVVSAPVVSGTAQVGQQLTGDPGTWTGSPTPTFTYQWQYCDAPGVAGVDWVARASATDSVWTSVTWGGAAGQERYVAVSNGGAGDRVMTSPDGITWTGRTAADGSSWSSVTWGDDTFVAVASGALAGQQQVMTSPDGFTWTARTAAANSTWASVTWGGPVGQKTFVAVAPTGTNRVMTSPDGVTWTARSAAVAQSWTSVTWGGPAGSELFVAVARTGSGDRVMTSPNGITWTGQTSAANNSWNSVTWGGPAGSELFVAVATTGSGNRVMTSPDGVTWTTRESAAENAWNSVTWGGPTGQELFVAVSGSGSGNRVMTSPDGVTWTTRESAAESAWTSTVWGGPPDQEAFVAVAESGAGNRVMTSALRNCSNTVNATSSTYTPIEADLDLLLRVQVTASNSEGSTLAVSPVTAAIAPASPAPPAPSPASAPVNVTAEPGVRSAVVSWLPPVSSGSFPISTYQVQAAPGGRTCLVTAPITSCDVARLTNGVAYTFEVRALTGVGWSAWSTPSAPVTPREVEPIIMISGARGEVRGKPGIIVAGTSEGFGLGAVVSPWLRVDDSRNFVQGRAQVPIESSGEFRWQRRAMAEVSVYFVAPSGIRSNVVTLPAK